MASASPPYRHFGLTVSSELPLPLDLADIGADADVVIVCVKAVEGVVDVLSRPARLKDGTQDRHWSYGSEDGSEHDLEDEPL